MLYVAAYQLRRSGLDKTRELVCKQIQAMGSAIFEIGLFNPDANKHRIGPAMIPRTWDTDELVRSIGWLKLQNLKGRNIYIRPRGEHDLSLVDDLKAAALDRMTAAGFAPALIVETSPGNYQAWMKHPRPLPPKMSSAVARTLADAFGGDKGAADWRHFGRLAGFTNRKLKYQTPQGLFPFVRLAASSGSTYSAADQFLANVERELEETTQRREQRVRQFQQQGSPRLLRTIDGFRRNPAYGGDDTRIDLAYAIYALSRGASQNQVEAVIRSRDLSHKGDDKRQAQYVERTIKKALAVADRTNTLDR
jgi:DNA primase RepB-like protein